MKNKYISKWVILDAEKNSSALEVKIKLTLPVIFSETVARSEVPDKGVAFFLNRGCPSGLTDFSRNKLCVSLRRVLGSYFVVHQWGKKVSIIPLS